MVHVVRVGKSKSVVVYYIQFRAMAHVVRVGKSKSVVVYYIQFRAMVHVVRVGKSKIMVVSNSGQYVFNLLILASVQLI